MKWDNVILGGGCLNSGEEDGLLGEGALCKVCDGKKVVSWALGSRRNSTCKDLWFRTDLLKSPEHCEGKSSENN